MKRRTLRIAFGIFVAWNLMTALINVAQARWDWVLFDLACTAIVACSWAVTERSLANMANTERNRQETIAHYKAMLEEMRRLGNDEGEKYAITMLSIWDS